MNTCFAELPNAKVPLRNLSINDLGDRYYAAPAKFHGKLKLAVHPEWISDPDPARAKPVSPTENTMAYILPLDISWVLLIHGLQQ